VHARRLTGRRQPSQLLSFRGHGWSQVGAGRCSLQPFRNALRRGRVPDQTKLERISIITGCVISARPAATCQPHAVLRSFRVFFVTNIECRKAEVGDFLLTEHDFVTHYRIACRRIGSLRAGCCRRSAGQRQRQSSSPQSRRDFAPALSFRSLFCARHERCFPTKSPKALPNHRSIVAVRRIFFCNKSTP
jgi:hypothetical protein